MIERREALRDTSTLMRPGLARVVPHGAPAEPRGAGPCPTGLDRIIALGLASAALVPIDVRTLTDEVLERVREQADANDIDLVAHCSAGIAWVRREAFSEALFALVDNAVRATRKGHPVMVDVRSQNVRDVIWQIQDTGDGVSKDALTNLRQLEEESSGSGIALAWAVIDEHGGTLSFESARGVGTTASVWLPARC